MSLEWKLCFSSDVAVPYRVPLSAQRQYERAGYTNFDMEIVPLLLGTFALALLSGLPAGELRVGGVHGRMGALPRMSDHGKGALDYLKIKLLDFMLPHVHPRFGVRLDTIGKKMNHPIYYNVHHEMFAYTDHLFEHYLDRFKDLNYAYLTIENGPTQDGARYAYDFADRFRQKGLENVGVTYDVLHDAIVRNGNDDSLYGMERVWSRVLAGIRPSTHIIHFPWGSEDGLPIEAMLRYSPQMLVDLRHRIDEVGAQIVTIENQHGFWSAINAAEEERLYRIGSELAAIGFFDPRHLVGRTPKKC